MKLQAETGEKKYEVEVRRDGEKVFAMIDGREYELEVSQPEPGVYLFKNNGKVTQVFVPASIKPGEPVSVTTGGRSFEIKIIDPKRLRGSGMGDAHSHGHAEIKTAMPGKVVRVLKGNGDTVERGDGVMVVEAMKMQNEIKAPKAGVVKEIKTAEGSTVSAGDVLAVIE